MVKQMQGWRALLCGALLAAGVAHGQDAPAPPENTPPAAAARQAAELARGDPVRWYEEDATEEARLRRLRKEIGAAFEEAKLACRRLPALERGPCLKEAGATYQREMAAIRGGAAVR